MKPSWPVRFLSFLSSWAILIAALIGPHAPAVTIVPVFDSSITSQPDAAAIEADINYTAAVISSLYTNNISVPIVFNFRPLPSGVGADNVTYYESQPYIVYRSALQNDASANPDNAILNQAVAYLGKGNCCGSVFLPQTQADMLDQYGLGMTGDVGPNEITLNSNLPWTFAGSITSCYGAGDINCNAAPATPSLYQTYDANQAFFHEENEILGGGGRGSALNFCPGCDLWGPLDYFRYSGPDSPSASTSSTQSYLSFDQGATDALGTNALGAPIYFFSPNFDGLPADAGDFNDFIPGTGFCGSYSDLIQGASCAGVVTEAYNTSSPEFTMMSAIGWDHRACHYPYCIQRGQGPQDPISGVVPFGSVPEPGALWLFASGMGLLVLRMRYASHRGSRRGA